jgi:hypothetical protein
MRGAQLGAFITGRYRGVAYNDCKPAERSLVSYLQRFAGESNPNYEESSPNYLTAG